MRSCESIQALRAFERRVLLANTVGDFMVPFGTAAIDATFESRPGFASAPAHARRPGLPARIAFDLPAVHADTAPACDAQSSAASFEQRAAAALNALGWRKVGVRFETVSILPLAHNKLCALTRTGPLLPRLRFFSSVCFYVVGGRIESYFPKFVLVARQQQQQQQRKRPVLFSLENVTLSLSQAYAEFLPSSSGTTRAVP